MRIITIFGVCDPLALSMVVATASGVLHRRVLNLMVEAKQKPPKCYVDGMLVALIQMLDEHFECIDVIFAILKESGL